MSALKNPFLAALAASLVYLLYVIGDTLTKMGADQVMPLLVVLIMSFYASSFSAAFFTWKQGHISGLFATQYYALQIFRGLCLAGITCGFVYGLTQIPVARAYILIFMSPFFTAILSMILLKERLTIGRCGAVIIGFVGVLYGGLGEGQGFALSFGWGEGAIIFAAFLYAVHRVCTRFLAQKDALPPMLLYPLLTRFLVMALVVPVFVEGEQIYEAASSPQMHIMMAFAAIAFLFGMVLNITLSANHEVQFLAPFHYTQIIWGPLAGFLVFGQALTQPVLIGGGLVILAGLILIFDEKK